MQSRQSSNWTKAGYQPLTLHLASRVEPDGGSNSLTDAPKAQGVESPCTAASGPECDTKHLCQSKGWEAQLLRHWPRDSHFTPLMWL